MISFFSRLLDLISPRRCCICGKRLSVAEQVICAFCNLHLPRTFYEKNPYDNDLAKTFWARIPIERATSMFFYYAKSEVSKMIYALKYGNRPDYGMALGKMFAKECLPTGFFQDIDAIVVVPLTRKREKKRGYNQSMEIAKGVNEITHIPILKNVIKRTKFVDSQTHKDRLTRVENVNNIFKLLKPNSIAGKHILLIDDIVTTGATLYACASILNQAPNVKFSILTLGASKH